MAPYHNWLVQTHGGNAIKPYNRWLSGILGLAICVSSLPGRATGACGLPRRPPIDPARFSLVIERVNSARYPDVDVFFRVNDIDGATPFHALKMADVTATDGPAGQTLAPRSLAPGTGPTGTEVVVDRLRPLAMAVNVDRSGSIRKIQDRILRAVSSTIAGMAGPGENTPSEPDEMYLAAFAGKSKNMETIARMGFSSDKARLGAFASAHLSTTANNTPLYKSWTMVLAEAAAHPYQFPQEARCVVTITDGRQWPWWGKRNKPCAMIASIPGLNVPCFNMGFPRLTETRTKQSSVHRPVLIHTANISHGAYFEPRAPLSAVPVVHKLPKQDSGQTALEFQEEVRDFVLDLLEEIATLYQNEQLSGAAYSDFPAELQQAAAKIFLDPAPTTQAALVAVFDTDDDPPLRPVDTVSFSHDDLKDLKRAVNSLRREAIRELTEADLDEFYQYQVANMFTKIRSSLKTVYKVTIHCDPDAPLDGAIRQLGLRVAYFQGLGGSSVDTSQVVNYTIPTIMDENKAANPRGERPTFLTDPNDPRIQAILAPTNPRGGLWLDDSPRLSVTTRLYEDTGVAVSEIASRTDGGQITAVSDEAALQLEALRITPDENVDAQAVVVEVKPLLPTCVSKIGNLRVQPDLSEKGKSRLLWYVLDASLERRFRFTVKQLNAITPPPTDPDAVVIPPDNPPGPDRIVETKLKVPLPLSAIYVADRTPPSIAVYFRPESAETNLAYVREDPPDAGLFTPKAFMSGPSFSRNGEFVVPQNVRVQLMVAAKDNFDRNHDHGYLRAASSDQAIPEWGKFPASGWSDSALLNHMPPYLERSEALSWRFETSQGRAGDVLPMDQIFRVAGEPIFMQVRAVDQSANVAELRIPIVVTPVALSTLMLRHVNERD